MIQLRYFDERPCRDVAGALGVTLDASTNGWLVFIVPWGSALNSVSTPRDG